MLSLLADIYFKWTTHIWDISHDHLVLALKYIIISQVIFILAQTLTKLSVLAFVHRTMGTAGGRLKTITEIAFAVIGLQGFIFIIVVIFQCRYDILD